MNQDPINYIKQSQAQGLTREQIVVALRQAGWQEEQIGEAFQELQTPTQVTKSNLLAKFTPRTLIITGALIGVLLIGGGIFVGGFFWQQKQPTQPSPQNPSMPTSSESPPTTMFNTYRAEDLGISFQYPSFFLPPIRTFREYSSIYELTFDKDFEVIMWEVPFEDFLIKPPRAPSATLLFGEVWEVPPQLQVVDLIEDYKPSSFSPDGFQIEARCIGDAERTACLYSSDQNYKDKFLETFSFFPKVSLEGRTDWQIYSDNANGFILEYPPTWVVEDREECYLRDTDITQPCTLLRPQDITRDDNGALYQVAIFHQNNQNDSFIESLSERSDASQECWQSALDGDEVDGDEVAECFRDDVSLEKREVNGLTANIFKVHLASGAYDRETYWFVHGGAAVGLDPDYFSRDPLIKRILESFAFELKSANAL